jgi:hypothetical protein
MFVAGLAIVRAHNQWVLDWTVLVTLSGWFFLGPRQPLLGRLRHNAVDDDVIDEDTTGRIRKRAVVPIDPAT